MSSCVCTQSAESGDTGHRPGRTHRYTSGRRAGAPRDPEPVVADAPPAAAGPLVVPTPAGAPLKTRFQGVDIARGVALIAMLAANIVEATIGDDGRPTLAGMTVIGRSATMFAMVAGISLALLSGGRRPVAGIARRAARANIAIRALCIGAIGLALGYIAPEDLGMILTFYGAFFLLAIPLIGLRPRTLVAIAGVLVVVGPLVLMGADGLGLEDAFDPYPTLTSPFTDPVGLVLLVLVTGFFPAITYMAYICVGLAIGRMDLSSTRVAVRLLVGGLALALAAWSASWLLIERLGGLRHLLAVSDPGTTPTDIIWDTWNSDSDPSWWWLALRVHHSGTPLDMLHTIGAAMAVLGTVLLLAKVPGVVRRLLRPVALAGAMTLTVYAAHAIVLATPLFRDDELALWLVIVAGALVFAVVWNRWMGQGPLERLVASAANRARSAVLAALTGAGPGPGRESQPSGSVPSTATAP
jgi:uncharacterized membrane protein YeiB